MAFTPNRIHVGPARIFVGVTNPVTGTPPSFITHTNGVPADGTEVGLTENDCVFTFDPKKTTIMAEQYYSGIAAYLTEEAPKVTFTAQESVVKTLQLSLDNIGQFSDGSKDAFYGGSGSGAFSVLTQSIFLSSRQRVDPTKYIIILLYLAYASKPFTYTFSRTKKATVPVELTGLADTTRNNGDACFQMYYEV